MPFPRAMARTNRYWANPIMRRLGGTFLPLMVIRHVGRKSGKLYDTPVWAFRDGDRLLIALTYGSGTDWLRNLQAAGSCAARYRGKPYRVFPLEILVGEPRAQPLPRVVQVALELIKVREYLLVDVSPFQESG